MRRRVALASLAMAAWIAGSTIGVVTPPPAVAAQPLLEIQQAHAGYVPALDGSKPIFILFIGSGARPDESVEHSLADSIHIVSIVPAKHKAALMSMSDELNKEAVRLRDAAQKKNVNDANTVLTRVNLAVRSMKLDE